MQGQPSLTTYNHKQQTTTTHEHKSATQYQPSRYVRTMAVPDTNVHHHDYSREIATLSQFDKYLQISRIDLGPIFQQHTRNVRIAIRRS